MNTINLKNIKVGLADDHLLVRSSVSKLVSSFPNCTVLFEAENGLQVTEFLKKHIIPDILLLDISMPVMDGFDTAIWVNKNFPNVRILALTMFSDEKNIVKMMKNGAKGYITKNIGPEILKEAIEAMATKNFYLPEEISNKLVNGLQHDLMEEAPVSTLTEREREFLRYAPTDLTYIEIAKKMNLSARTVEDYRNDLFDKLKVNTRMALAVYAIRNDLF